MSNGLYNGFKLNRPLTEEEINYQLRQDFSGMETASSDALDNGVVIRMNSTYLELVDQYYAERGLGGFYLLTMLSAITLGVLTLLFVVIFHPNTEVEFTLSYVFALMFAVLMLTALGLFFLKLLIKSWFTWTHYPVRFNRKTQMVHVFKFDGTIISAPWQEVFFTRVHGGGVVPAYHINSNILSADKTTVLDTFTLGFYNSQHGLVSNWAFIYSYMTVDNCLEELRDIIAFCPPIADKKENFLFGLQSLIRVESRLEWLFLLVKFPMALLVCVARYLTMCTCKIPRWSAEVEADCQVDPNDPINVSAANNPKHLWRYILANQTLADYKALYQRQAQATDRLREKVQAHKKHAESN